MKYAEFMEKLKTIEQESIELTMADYQLLQNELLNKENQKPQYNIAQDALPVYAVLKALSLLTNRHISKIKNIELIELLGIDEVRIFSARKLLKQLELI